MFGVTLKAQLVAAFWVFVLVGIVLQARQPKPGLKNTLICRISIFCVQCSPACRTTSASLVNPLAVTRT